MIERMNFLHNEWLGSVECRNKYILIEQIKEILYMSEQNKEGQIELRKSGNRERKKREEYE